MDPRSGVLVIGVADPEAEEDEVLQEEEAVVAVVVMAVAVVSVAEGDNVEEGALPDVSHVRCGAADPEHKTAAFAGFAAMFAMPTESDASTARAGAHEITRLPAAASCGEKGC